MLQFFSDNLGTILVILVLLVVVGLILRKLIHDKRAGKTTCGCGCSGCANAKLCHSKAKKK